MLLGMWSGLVLVVLPLMPPKSGPKMCSAAITSFLCTGKLLIVLLSMMRNMVCLELCPMDACSLRAVVASLISLFVYSSLFFLTVRTNMDSVLVVE